VIGPWLDGEEPVYADLVVGAWLAMAAECMPVHDWERVRGWHGGLWGRVHDALEPLRKMR
jgi:glutathione S-transferase